MNRYLRHLRNVLKRTVADTGDSRVVVASGGMHLRKWRPPDAQHVSRQVRGTAGPHSAVDAERNLHRNDVSGSPDLQSAAASCRQPRRYDLARYSSTFPAPSTRTHSRPASRNGRPVHDALSCSTPRPKNRVNPRHCSSTSPTSAICACVRKQWLTREHRKQVRELLGERLDRWCNRFSRFSAYFLGAITREDQSTVICGFDHAICDGWSMSIPIPQISTLYREYEAGVTVIRSRLNLLPEPGSFLTTTSGNRQPRIQSPATTGLRVGGPSSEHAGVTLPIFP